MVSIAAQPAPAETGQPRDETGRFAPKPSPEASPVTEPSPGGEPPVEPAAPSPFAYKGDGQDVQIPGSESGPEGVFIPAAEVPHIQQLLAEGHAWAGSAQKYFHENSTRQQATERRAKAAEEQVQAVEAQLTQVLGHFEQLVEASKDYPLDRILESPMAQWLLDVRGGWGVLKAEAKTTRIEREHQAARERLQEIESREQEAQLRPKMDATLSDHILALGGQAGLDRDAMEAIYADLNSPDYAGVTWIKAPHDDPLNNISKGETVLNLAIVQREIQRVTRMLAPYKTATPAPAPVTSGAPPKTPATPVRKPTPPPTVSATRGPTPRKVLAEPTSKEEADRWLVEGGNDPD